MGIKKRKLLGLALMAAMVSPWSLPGPATAEVFELDSVKNLYEGVSFDHDMHIEITGEDCTACHHHTAGTAPVDPLCVTCHANSPEADDPSCKSCHAKDVFDADNMKKNWDTPLLHHRNKPGLKAAYHRNCLGCHEEIGAPTGCTDCHAMTEVGEKFYNTGKYAPEPTAAGQGGGHH
ncbi:MAG: class III cytochrome C [Desulfobulbaceae bacterium]|nr:MAG: class III cytochrome C [Desulfobulbaceae bacterium]